MNYNVEEQHVASTPEQPTPKQWILRIISCANDVLGLELYIYIYLDHIAIMHAGIKKNSQYTLFVKGKFSIATT